MKIVYHVKPEGMPSGFEKQIRWLVEHGGEKAEAMVASMQEAGGDAGTAH